MEPVMGWGVGVSHSEASNGTPVIPLHQGSNPVTRNTFTTFAMCTYHQPFLFTSVYFTPSDWWFSLPGDSHTPRRYVTMVVSGG